MRSSTTPVTPVASTASVASTGPVASTASPSRLRLRLLLLCCVFGIAACGVRGPPRPPTKNALSVAHAVRSSEAALNPHRTADLTSLGVSGIDVTRSERSHARDR